MADKNDPPSREEYESLSRAVFDMSVRIGALETMTRSMFGLLFQPGPGLRDQLTERIFPSIIYHAETKKHPTNNPQVAQLLIDGEKQILLEEFRQMLEVVDQHFPPGGKKH